MLTRVWSAMSNTFERTRRTGLLHHDTEKAFPGYVCYSPVYSTGEVYLLALNGEIAHRWETGYPAGMWGYILPNGNLFYGGKDPDQAEQDRFGAWEAFRGGVMLELDPGGNVVWEHHDAITTIMTLGARRAEVRSTSRLSRCRRNSRRRYRAASRKATP